MDQHNHHNSGFGNGFLLGFIVGAAVIFFLFTKRGKQLFKIITEEGLAGVEEFKDILDMDEEDEEIEYEERPQKAVIARTEAVVHKVGSKAKRFFRGTPKKR
jgi:hypothetical protein